MHKSQLTRQGNINALNNKSHTPDFIRPAFSQPRIGRGFKPGDEIGFDFKPQVLSKSEAAKKFAISKLKSPIVPKSPNEISKKHYQKTSEFKRKISENLSKSFSPKNDEKVNEKSLLSGRRFSADELQKIINKKSNHQNEVEEEENAQQALYFMKLEKKEAMEEKMLSVSELKCIVVSCKQCNYTAHKPSEFCINEHHSLSKHEAVKRFFECTTCKARTWTFGKIPKDACRNCGGGSFSRTTMGKPKKGPTLDSEKLQIRGEELKFLNSLK